MTIKFFINIENEKMNKGTKTFKGILDKLNKMPVSEFEEMLDEKDDIDYGTKILNDVIEKLKKMSVAEYEAILDRIEADEKQ